MIYLDNGATTFPKPLSVLTAVDRANRFAANSGRSGYKLALKSSENIFECRQKTADFFGLENVENCILTPSCTIALNTVIYGVLKPGDHVVISSLEHNSVLRPLLKLRDSRKISFDVAEVFESDDDATVDSFRKCMNDKTKLVVCTHASNVFGIKLPVKRIAALCKYYGVLLCIDAAQSAGVIDINVNEIGANFLCIAGHKGLYGPMGTGALLISGECIPDSLYQGGTGSSTLDFSEPDILPDKFESGTVNYAGFVGLSFGLDFVIRKQPAQIYAHEMKLVRRLYQKLSCIENVELYTDLPDAQHYAPLLSFNINGYDPNTVASILDKRFSIAVRAGYHCSPLAHKYMGTGDHGTVRVCPSAFTEDFEIDRLISAVHIISVGKK